MRGSAGRGKLSVNRSGWESRLRRYAQPERGVPGAVRSARVHAKVDGCTRWLIEQSLQSSQGPVELGEVIGVWADRPWSVGKHTHLGPTADRASRWSVSPGDLRPETAAELGEIHRDQLTPTATWIGRHDHFTPERGDAEDLTRAGPAPRGPEDHPARPWPLEGPGLA